MAVFLVWIGIISLGVVGGVILLWRKSRSRFQTKLTIFFLLFVLIPSIPLTLFVANLLTQSADVLLLPGMGEALETSLKTLRTQVEEPGKKFLTKHTDPAAWTQTLLRDEGVDFVGHYRLSERNMVHLNTLRLPTSSLNPGWHPQPESLLDALSTTQTSRFIPVGEKTLIAVYCSLTDATVAVAVYPIAPYIVDAKTEIDQALGVYNTLSLLKESIIQKKLIWVLAVLLVGGLTLVSVFAAKKFSQGISQPVQVLVEGMNRVAGGDLNHQVEIKTQDEFRFLVDSFNTMTRELKTSRQKLIQAERLAAWQEVARQISHELKNSLTPISISLRRLRSHIVDKSPSPKIAVSLQSMEEELHSIERMAAEFSEFARMPQPQKSTVNLNEIVQSVVLLTQPWAGRINIQTHLSSHLPSIQADPEQMKRLLHNLIKNAVEASHDPETVSVTTQPVESAEHKIELEIQDQGEGMDEEELERIFQPYYTTKQKGTGLGLAIVQKIVEAHDGEIRVESAAGKGTRVTVRL